MELSFFEYGIPFYSYRCSTQVVKVSVDRRRGFVNIVLWHYPLCKLLFCTAAKVFGHKKTALLRGF